MPASEVQSASRSEISARLRAAGCVFAEDEARLLLAAAMDPTGLEAAVELRVAGYPLEQILGWAAFCGLRIVLDAGVFVPRRRTELLVNEAVALLRADMAGENTGGESPAGQNTGRRIAAGKRTQGAQPAVVIDLCCGSGAVGVAIASRMPGLALHAADLDPAAVACARRNVDRVGGEVHEGDLFGALPPVLKGSARILTVNAPYVPTCAIGTMPYEAREHEPLIALDGGADGLDFHRRVAAGAGEWLVPGGYLIIETSQRQARFTESIMADAGFAVRTVRSDRLDGTVVIGRAD
jgi:release factor glutamine methyltransferase